MKRFQDEWRRSSDTKRREKLQEGNVFQGIQRIHERSSLFPAGSPYKHTTAFLSKSNIRLCIAAVQVPKDDQITSKSVPTASGSARTTSLSSWKSLLFRLLRLFVAPISLKNQVSKAFTIRWSILAQPLVHDDTTICAAFILIDRTEQKDWINILMVEVVGLRKGQGPRQSSIEHFLNAMADVQSQRHDKNDWVLALHVQL